MGKDYSLAQRQAVKFTDWLREGKDLESEMEKCRKEEKSKKITLREFYTTFIERHGTLQSNSMQVIYKYRFENILRCPNIVGVPISSITKGVVLKYMNERMTQDGVKAATVNREATLIRNMLNRAVEWDLIEQNPVKGIRLFREEDKRDVNLSLSQIETLVNELPDTIADIVELALHTGFRKENILSLKIESIRFHDLTSDGEVELKVKGGRIEWFHLGPQAIEVIKRAIGKRQVGFVFLNPKTGTRYKYVHKSFDHAVRRLELKVNGTKLRFHDLRHVFATWHYRNGVPLDRRRELLGHEDRKTTDRYTTGNRLAAGSFLKEMPINRKSG